MADVIMRFGNVSLGEQMVARGMISESQLQQAHEQQRQKGSSLVQALITLGFVKISTLTPSIEEITGFPFIDLSDCSINPDTVRRIPELLERRKRLLPFADDGDDTHVAMADPFDLAAIDDLQARLNRRIIPFMALDDDIEDAISRIYDASQKTQSVLDEIAGGLEADPDLSIDELMDMAEDAPIVRLVNSIILSAVGCGASDIHIEPQESSVRVRFRLDGLLYEQTTIPKTHLKAVVSRIKIVGNMNIAERRRPQDGRFSIRSETGSDYDLRVSIMPVVHGEKVVMRVLAKSSSFGNKDRLGFFPEQKLVFESFIRRPYGIILVTGPTGSGKSTTLFAALNSINDAEKNINTVEDPVEYDLPGANQMQMNAKIGVTFAAGLRTLLRQDPDVIMVGEIRDKETAEIAIQAALTGHLVLSTLHTNDAPGALTRLQNMGVEPFLVSSAVLGVIGQRLLRTVCPFCKTRKQATQAMVDSMGIPLVNGQLPMLTHGVGCQKCNNRGMKGRTAVYEVMPISDVVRDMVLRECAGSQLHAQAVAEGMMTMRQAALRKVTDGITTPEEVARVLFSSE